MVLFFRELGVLREENRNVRNVDLLGYIGCFGSYKKVVHIRKSGSSFRELVIETFFFKISQSLVALRKKVV